MNIIFEGINASGKTTIINELKKILEEKNISYECISDLDNKTPFTQILRDAVSQDVFLRMNENFPTSISETLALAGDFHYLQEQYRNSDSVNIYDRDVISILSYQKEILKRDYPNDWEEFYSGFRQIMLFGLKKYNLLIYVDIPFELNLERIKKRDNLNPDSDFIELLYEMKNNMQQEIQYFYESGLNVLYLDGRDNPHENALKIEQNLLMTEDIKKYYRKMY